MLEHGAPYSLPTAVMKNDMPRVKQLLDEDPLRIHERGAHDGQGADLLHVRLVDVPRDNAVLVRLRVKGAASGGRRAQHRTA